MTKPFHAGHAAENGTVAADLAAARVDVGGRYTGRAARIFPGRGRRLRSRLDCGTLARETLVARLSPGVSIKPHPCGSLSHPAMGEMLRLIRQYDIKASDVEKVDVGGNHAMKPLRSCTIALPPALKRNSAWNSA